MSDIKITNGMKAENNGRHSFTVEEPCPKCLLHLDEHYDEVECLCNSSEDQTYQKVLTVPWDTCKDIYKSMRASYERDIWAAKSGEYQHIHVGQTDCISDPKECASILDTDDDHPIFEVAVLGRDALNELIHYIESNAGD